MNPDPRPSTLALTRPVSPTLDRCELAHHDRVPIDVERAAAQHAAYEAALEAAGLEVVRVSAAPELPDAVFIEDTAVVLEDVAVLALPGAASRRPEVPAVAEALRAYRPLAAIEAPATLDGGDVLVMGRRLFVGESGRTNAEGRAQLRSILEPEGYEVRPVALSGCLHLKSAATAVSDDTVLLNPGWVDPASFEGCRTVEVAAGEPRAGNVMRLPAGVLMAAGQPATAARLRALDVRVTTVDVSELMKAEAGVTCCALLVAR